MARQRIRLAGPVPALRCWLIACVGLAVVAVGCGDSTTTEGVQAGGSASTSATSWGVITFPTPTEWACEAPATFTPVAPPPGVEGLPEVKSTAAAREYAEGEVDKFAERPTVVDGEQSDDRAIFFLVDESDLVVEEVTVKRSDDGRWILDQSTVCRELETGVSGPTTTS